MAEHRGRTLHRSPPEHGIFSRLTGCPFSSRAFGEIKRGTDTSSIPSRLHSVPSSKGGLENNFYQLQSLSFTHGSVVWDWGEKAWLSSCLLAYDRNSDGYEPRSMVTNDQESTGKGSSSWRLITNLRDYQLSSKWYHWRIVAFFHLRPFITPAEPGARVFENALLWVFL